MATQLRKRMLEDMQLRGMAKKTQESYLRSVRKLAEHYNKPPDKITEEELRQYFLYITNVKKYARATVTIALCGIKFFYNYTSRREWPSVKLIRPKREKKLPVILSVEEVRRILNLVRLDRYRTCLTTIYSCGLRLQAGVYLFLGSGHVNYLNNCYCYPKNKFFRYLYRPFRLQNCRYRIYPAGQYPRF